MGISPDSVDQPMGLAQGPRATGTLAVYARTIEPSIRLRRSVKPDYKRLTRADEIVDPGATEYYLDAKETLVTVKSSISLTDEQHTFAKALVEAGRYSSLSAVLQQSVDLLRQRMDAEELETAALRELLSRRRKGAFVGAERMDTRLARMIADKRREHGLSS